MSSPIPAQASPERPYEPIPGALKLISPYGCAFMRHCWADRRSLKEPEWYAAIQQATTLRHGREFAHALSRDYKGYNPAEVDEKFDHALENPPVGCQWIRENFPQSACATCPVKAPYHMAKKSILELVQAADEPMKKFTHLDEHMERIHRFAAGETVGLSTQFPGLDEYMRFRNSELIVIGAMQSIGKTQFMVDCMYRLASAGIPVFGFSAETGVDTLTDRFMSRAAEIDSRALRNERSTGPLTPDEWARLGAAKKELADLPIFLDFTSLSAEQVLAQVEAALLQHNLPLDGPYVLFFDYLQFGAKMPGDDTEYDRISRLSSEFKFVAKILDRPVVVFSQLRRDKEGDDEPDLTWFKGSGHIESDANTAIIFTGKREHSAIVERLATIVKQKEGQANVKVMFHVQQQSGLWESESTPGPNELVGAQALLGFDVTQRSPFLPTGFKQGPHDEV